MVGAQFPTATGRRVQEFDFMPPTYMLPEDRGESSRVSHSPEHVMSAAVLSRLLHSKNEQTYILKPDGGALRALRVLHLSRWIGRPAGQGSAAAG